MTSIPVSTHEVGAQADLKIWNCDACRCVYLRAAGVLLTFTREVYAAFGHAVAECYFGGTFGARSAPDEFTLLSSITEMVN